MDAFMDKPGNAALPVPHRDDGHRPKRPRRRLWLFIVLVIFVSNLIGSVVAAISSGRWLALLGPLATLAIIGLIITTSWGSIQRLRDEYRRRFEDSPDQVGLRDAAIFSLSWSREIYRNIPADRKRLVRFSFILIGLGMGIILLQSGFSSIFTVVLVAALVLSGINLLVWVVAVERQEKDRLQIELETARRMQLSLLPSHDPEFAGFDISGCCIPAQNVGGDHFDYVWLGRERKKFAVAVVDVSGKGMDAALTAIYTSGAFVSAVQHDSKVGSVLDSLNAAIYSRQNRKLFVSFLLLGLKTDPATLEYVNAGQCRPLLLRRNVIQSLPSPKVRFPLGVTSSTRHEAVRIGLQAGDTLLLYTDGVSDAMDREGHVFGDERLQELFRRVGTTMRSARKIVDAIKTEVLAFSDPAEQQDDLTLVVVRVHPSSKNRARR